MMRLALSLPLALYALCAMPAMAQDTTVIQAENVRFAYAQVLRVTPVYQTLTATSIQQQCDQSPSPDDSSGLSRVVGAVKEALTRKPEEVAADCVAVPIEREFRRPIAYDVDYIFRGMKYRSRLPYDPGNRLNVQVSLTPLVQPPDEE